MLSVVVVFLLFRFQRCYKFSVLPDPACIIFGPCDDGVALVVEGAGKDLVLVAIKHLKLGAVLDRPNSARLVAARRDDLVALWVEFNYVHFVLVTL